MSNKRIVRGAVDLPVPSLIGLVGQESPLPPEFPRAVVKTAKLMKAINGPASHVYLPAEYAGLQMLVIPISNEQSDLIYQCNARAEALKILEQTENIKPVIGA